jgi:hypothetical protein
MRCQPHAKRFVSVCNTLWQENAYIVISHSLAVDGFQLEHSSDDPST